MKKFLSVVLALIFIFTFILSSCSKNTIDNGETHIDLSSNQKVDVYTPNNLPDDELVYVGKKGVLKSTVYRYSLKDVINEADVIAEITIEKRLGETNEPLENTFFSTRIDTLFKGDFKESDEIKIMQLGNSDFTEEGYPLFRSGDKMLLFLKKAVGKGFEEFYWILGEYGNSFNIVEYGGKEYAVHYFGGYDEVVNLNIDNQEVAAEVSKGSSRDIYQLIEKDALYSELGRRAGE